MIWLTKSWLTKLWAGLTRQGRGPGGGFVNEGDDVRWNPFGIAGLLQRRMSFKSFTQPVGIMFALPLFVAVNVPINPFSITAFLLLIASCWLHAWWFWLMFLTAAGAAFAGAAEDRGRHKYLIMRIGFRYDTGWPGYIFPEATVKILPHTMYY